MSRNSIGNHMGMQVPTLPFHENPVYPCHQMETPARDIDQMVEGNSTESDLTDDLWRFLGEIEGKRIRGLKEIAEW